MKAIKQNTNTSIMGNIFSFDKLMQLKQDGKIGWCEFALRSEHADEYRQWCDDHGLIPNDVNAELFLEQTEEKLYDGSIAQELA